MPKLSRQLSLILLLAFILAGLQAIKESPWHEHNQHVADCALCHLQLNDYAVIDSDTRLHLPKVRSVYHANVRQFNSVQPRASYQVRAPPLLIS